ncbi:hypothetical protein ABMA27_001363 [Loxostege sticticalis]|uniref:FLYWCH-type domain-containing protein n=1 Tax=Loxostege sticticalis TaxID=481309 RepID=A0ABR3HY69_LOXSC
MSRNGNPLITSNGFTYFRKQKNLKSGVERWACSTHHHKGCKAALSMIDGVIIRKNTDHNHDNSMRNYY